LGFFQAIGFLELIRAEMIVQVVWAWRPGRLRSVNIQACPWECHSYGNPMGNVPWGGMGQHTFVFPMRLRN